MSDTSGKYQLLLTLGLADLEAKIYLFLAEGQPQTALHISRTLAIPRTSVYDTLTRLGERGLTARVIKAKKTLYKASPLSTFQSLIRIQEEKTTAMAGSLAQLEQELKFGGAVSGSTEVRYYQGPEGLRQMMWNCLRAEKEIVGYSVFGRVDVVGFKFQQRFVKEFADRQLKDRVIANPTLRTLDYIFRDVKPGFHQMSFQNIRTLPDNQLYIAGDTMIYNNVYAQSYWPVSDRIEGDVGQKGEVVGVEIENSDFVRHELSIFELLWSLAKPISSGNKTK